MVVRTRAPHRRDLLLVSAAALAWGVGGAVAAALFRSGGLGPMAVSFWRMVIATALLTAVQAVRPLAGPATASRRSAVTTGIGMAVYYGAYYVAVDRAGLALSTLITLGAGPVFVAVGAGLLLGERLDRRGGLALAVAFAGLGLLVGDPVGAGAVDPVGVAAALVSALGYSAVTLYGRTSGGGGGGTLPSFCAGLLVLAPFALVEGVRPQTGDLVPVLGWLLFLGVVPTLLAYRWYFAGLRTVPAATAAVIVLLEPVVATLLGVALFGEALSTGVAVGAALLLAAVALLIRP
ncbi:DMT family transporter [Micromonospora fluostatini]|uniref:DMT family transporter n=1 Tax=Micromonospora sp. JCM 30529 TaxID=3421643 RepID=UPI003D16D296